MFASTVALATFLPSVAFSQTPKPSSPEPSNTEQPAPSGQPQSIEDVLQLTSQQKEQIRSILVDRQKKIEGVLTEQQRTTLAQARQNRQSPSTALQAINLSDTQKTQIASIAQASEQQIRGVLTNEQKQKLDSLIQQSRQRSSQ